MTDEPRIRLSRERILAAARTITRDGGVEALSMRRLAQELDVWPMSVYRYFQDKDALLDALAAGAAGGVEAADPGADWRDRMRVLLHGARAALTDPSGLGGRLPRAFLTPDGLRLPEAGLAILGEAGFDEPAAASAWRALWSYTFGFATFTLAPRPEDAERAAAAALAALPRDDYPALASAAPAFAAALASDDEEFDRGLELLLGALEPRTKHEEDAA
jgi:AcrR family transcriptional regulator